MPTLSEFQATRKSFDVSAADYYEYDNVPRTELQLTLDSTGWANVDLLNEEQAGAAYFYQFTHSDNPEPARYIIVKDGKGRYINAWTMGSFGFETLEAAEKDLLGELNG